MGDSRVADVFAGGGEVGRDHAAVDWSATPLGLPEQWLQSADVGMLLTSRFSMWLAWGPDLAMLADHWGTRPVPGGKAVWCVVGLDPGEA